MSMTVNHVTYLSAKTVSELADKVKIEWKVDLVLDTAPDDPRSWSVGLETGEVVSISPCPFGYLAQYESQERLTGDAADHDHVARINDENWERMQYALSELRR